MEYEDSSPRPPGIEALPTAPSGDMIEYDSYVVEHGLTLLEYLIVNHFWPTPREWGP